MNQALDQNISFRMLLRFALPTIASNIFMSIYTAVDGMFVSRLVGQEALSAINIVMPMIPVFYGNRNHDWLQRNSVGRKKTGRRKRQGVLLEKYLGE